jgi:hypothetical protein
MGRRARETSRIADYVTEAGAPTGLVAVVATNTRKGRVFVGLNGSPLLPPRVVEFDWRDRPEDVEAKLRAALESARVERDTLDPRAMGAG